jgi:hypothetical protein
VIHFFPDMAFTSVISVTGNITFQFNEPKIDFKIKNRKSGQNSDEMIVLGIGRVGGIPPHSALNSTSR